MRPPDLAQTGGTIAPIIQPPKVTPAAGMAVRIREPQVEDEPPPPEAMAPFTARISAAAIDLLLSSGLVLASYWILPGFAGRLGWLVALAYWIVRDSLAFSGGRSVGKMAMNLQVTTLENQSLVGNWRVALLRNAALAIPFFGLIELYVLLTREDTPSCGRRLGDQWAKTKVMTAPEPEPKDGEEAENEDVEEP